MWAFGMETSPPPPVRETRQSISNHRGNGTAHTRPLSPSGKKTQPFQIRMIKKRKPRSERRSSLARGSTVPPSSLTLGHFPRLRHLHRKRDQAPHDQVHGARPRPRPRDRYQCGPPWITPYADPVGRRLQSRAYGTAPPQRGADPYFCPPDTDSLRAIDYTDEGSEARAIFEVRHAFFGHLIAGSQSLHAHRNGSGAISWPKPVPATTWPSATSARLSTPMTTPSRTPSLRSSGGPAGIISCCESSAPTLPDSGVATKDSKSNAMARRPSPVPSASNHAFM
jgi:hypothetical protein